MTPTPHNDAMVLVRADEVVVHREHLEDWEATARELASEVMSWFDDNESGYVRLGHTTAGNIAMRLMDTAGEIAERLGPPAGSEGGGR